MTFWARFGAIDGVRPRPERLGAGVAGVAVAVALALAIGVPWVSWVGVAVAVAGVVGAVPQLGPVAAGVLGVAWCAARFDDGGTLDLRVVPVAAGLLLVAELVAWSAEARVAAPPGVPATTRLLVLSLTAAAGAAATALVAAVAAAPVADDLALAALGVAAVALVGAVGVGLARSVSGG